MGRTLSVVGFTASVLLLIVRMVMKKKTSVAKDIRKGFLGVVGNTPLIKLERLSIELGVTILGKAEFLNPGGSVKDRVIKKVIEDAEKTGQLHPAKGYGCHVFLPDDIAQEKIDLLKTLGAEVTRLPNVSIVDDDHCCKKAEAASRDPSMQERGFFVNQFENLSNLAAHYEHTSVELLEQTNGTVTTFVGSAGTGGTIAGISRRLKEFNKNIKVFLADPQGSALYGRVKHGVLYTREDREGSRRRIYKDTITEGIGLNRLTENFRIASNYIDDAVRVTDREAVIMSRYLMRREGIGLFLGSSSAVNCAAIAKLVKSGHIPLNSVVVTILCDSGSRYLSTFYSEEFLQKEGLLPHYNGINLGGVIDW